MKNIFDSTKLKLTGLYLLIIMFVTIAFSFFIFSGVNQATEHALDVQRAHMERQFQQVPPEFRGQIFIPLKTDAILEIREKVLMNLIVINLVVLGISGTLGYYLAGITLRPIEEMIIKQKRFISDAAHELKTPLTAMKTDLEVTLRDKDLKLSEAKETLSNTLTDIDELSAITTNLLAASKYNNSDIYNKNIEVLNLDEIIQKVVKKLNPKAKANNIVISQKTEPVQIKADQIEIEKVLMNLVDNAIKYSKPDSEVSISLKVEKKNAIIKVKDQGIGIDLKTREMIFEPFYRGDKSRTKSKTEGYGLGLAITRDIIESYRGKIEVQSKPNKGSTFIVTLPLNS